MNEKFLNRLRKRSEEVGDCWEWTGAMQTTTGTPVMRYDGRAQPVRRAIALELGLSLQGKLATCKCVNMRCVNPEHVVAVTRQQLQKRTAKATGMHMSPARCRKLAQSARRTGKLTESQVAEIRAIEGVTQRDIAKMYGITQPTVSAIRRGVKWKDYSTPWLQLMGVKP